MATTETHIYLLENCNLIFAEKVNSKMIIKQTSVTCEIKLNNHSFQILDLNVTRFFSNINSILSLKAARLYLKLKEEKKPKYGCVYLAKEDQQKSHRHMVLVTVINDVGTMHYDKIKG